MITAERCAISTHTIRSRSYSTDSSSESSWSTSCSTTTPELSDEDSPKFQKKSSPQQVVNNINVVDEINNLKLENAVIEATESNKEQQ